VVGGVLGSRREAGAALLRAEQASTAADADTVDDVASSFMVLRREYSNWLPTSVRPRS